MTYLLRNPARSSLPSLPSVLEMPDDERQDEAHCEHPGDPPSDQNQVGVNVELIPWGALFPRAPPFGYRARPVR